MPARIKSKKRGADYLYNWSCRLRRFLNQEFTPVTKTVSIISGIIFLSSLIPVLNLFFQNNLSLNPFTLFLKPWTLITFPLFNEGILSMVFAILWYWMVGGSLERSWGSKIYGIFIIIVALVTGLSVTLVETLNLTGHVQINGLWIPLVAITWAWAESSPQQEVLFWGIVPIKARWLAWLNALIIFLGYSQMGGVLLGLASISGIGVVYLFQGKGPFSRGFRYRTWKQEISGDRLKDKMRRKRFKVIK